jgi:hypothetical protein
MAMHDAGLLCHIGACRISGLSSPRFLHSQKISLNILGTMSTEAKNDYILHNHNELARQALQHIIIKDAMKGRQVFAPIQSDVSRLEILDVCTGSGPSQRPIYLSVETNCSRRVDS